MTNKKQIGHILSAELEQQRLFICKFRLVLYYLFICKFRHCLIGLGLVLKWAYKACGSIVGSLVQMLDDLFSGFV